MSPAGGRRASRRHSVVWTARASADLQAVGDYIAASNPGAAAKWVTQLIRAVEKMALVPLAGRMVPELGRADVREVLLRTYRIVYCVTSERLEVLTVFESHRTFPKDL